MEPSQSLSMLSHFSEVGRAVHPYQRPREQRSVPVRVFPAQLYEQARVTFSSMRPSQSSSLLLHVSVPGGAEALQVPHFPAAQVDVPLHFVLESVHAFVRPSSIEPSQSLSMLSHFSEVGRAVQLTHFPFEQRSVPLRLVPAQL
jgi:hypothetical protein